MGRTCLCVRMSRSLGSYTTTNRKFVSFSFFKGFSTCYATANRKVISCGYFRLVEPLRKELRKFVFLVVIARGLTNIPLRTVGSFFSWLLREVLSPICYYEQEVPFIVLVLENN